MKMPHMIVSHKSPVVSTTVNLEEFKVACLYQNMFLPVPIISLIKSSKKCVITVLAKHHYDRAIFVCVTTYRNKI